MEERVEAVMTIKHEDLPYINEKFDLNIRKTSALAVKITNEHADYQNKIMKKRVWFELNRHVKECKKKNRNMQKMIRNFRKFHLFTEFKRFRLKM